MRLRRTFEQRLGTAANELIDFERRFAGRDDDDIRFERSERRLAFIRSLSHVGTLDVVPSSHAHQGLARVSAGALLIAQLSGLAGMEAAGRQALDRAFATARIYAYWKRSSREQDGAPLVVHMPDMADLGHVDYGAAGPGGRQHVVRLRHDSSLHVGGVPGTPVHEALHLLQFDGRAEGDRYPERPMRLDPASHPRGNTLDVAKNLGYIWPDDVPFQLQPAELQALLEESREDEMRVGFLRAFGTFSTHAGEADASESADETGFEGMAEAAATLMPLLGSAIRGLRVTQARPVPDPAKHGTESFDTQEHSASWDHLANIASHVYDLYVSAASKAWSPSLLQRLASRVEEVRQTLEATTLHPEAQLQCIDAALERFLRPITSDYAWLTPAGPPLSREAFDLAHDDPVRWLEHVGMCGPDAPWASSDIAVERMDAALRDSGFMARVAEIPHRLADGEPVQPVLREAVGRLFAELTDQDFKGMVSDPVRHALIPAVFLDPVDDPRVPCVAGLTLEAGRREPLLDPVTWEVSLPMAFLEDERFVRGGGLHACLADLSVQAAHLVMKTGMEERYSSLDYLSDVIGAHEHLVNKAMVTAEERAERRPADPSSVCEALLHSMRFDVSRHPLDRPGLPSHWEAIKGRADIAASHGNAHAQEAIRANFVTQSRYPATALRRALASRAFRLALDRDGRVDDT